MHPSLFKALCSISYWPWVGYPMGKHTLILKGGAICCAILVAAVKVLCSYHRVYIYTMYRTMWYLSVVMPFYYLGCMHNLITLQYKCLV